MTRIPSISGFRYRSSHGAFFSPSSSAVNAGPAKRLAREREHYPLRTAGNFMFVLGTATLFYLLAFFAVALYSAIIEF